MVKILYVKLSRGCPWTPLGDFCPPDPQTLLPSEKNSQLRHYMLRRTEYPEHEADLDVGEENVGRSERVLQRVVHVLVQLSRVVVAVDASRALNVL